MVDVCASVNLPLHHEDQKFSSGTGSPGWSQKKGRKTVVVVVMFCSAVRLVCDRCDCTGVIVKLSTRSAVNITSVIQYATEINDSSLKLVTKFAVQRMQPCTIF